MDRLLGPFVDPELVGSRRNDLAGTAPVRHMDQLAAAVRDHGPVGQARQPRVVHQVAQALVRALGVLDVAAGHHLIVELAQREVIAVGLILGQDGVDRGDSAQPLRAEALVDECFLHDFCSETCLAVGCTMYDPVGSFILSLNTQRHAD